MGEAYPLPIPGFNRSIRVESRPDRLTGDAGAIALREIAHRLGLLDWLDDRLRDSRDPDAVVHPLIELVTTQLLLLAQGWRRQDDADRLRDDPALRMAVSTRRGVSPLLPAPIDEDGRPLQPQGLASQPTMSRLLRTLSSESNRAVLREAIAVLAGRRIRADNGGRRRREVVLDVDSLPVHVHGHQAGAEYNGHYRDTVYHPLVANLGDDGDLISVKLRKGKVHSADGATDFVLEALDRVERQLCQVACVRVDAGFPSEPLLAALEGRGTHYVARIRKNARLDRLAIPYLLNLPPRDWDEHRTLAYELTYKAGSWSRARRVILVVVQEPGELFPRHFWLLTSYPPRRMSAEQVLARYRRRGKAEGHYGEWMSVLAPALSSTRRTKSHHRGEPVDKADPSRDPFACNEAMLLLHALAYELMHVARCLAERPAGRGRGLTTVRAQLLKIPARVLLHGRRAIVVIPKAAADLWSDLWGQIEGLRVHPAPARAG